MDKPDKIKKIAEKIKGLRNAMLVTVTGDVVRGRPMSTQELEFDGNVWFMTAKDTQKIQDIKNNPNVGLMYGDGSGVKFVSLSGKAELVDDRAKIHELWSDFNKAWFTGEDDPNIILIKVVVSSAEYWDYQGGKPGALLDMAKSAITGAEAKGGVNEKFDW